MIYHIDLSNHYSQKKYSIIAMVSVDLDENKSNDQVMKAVVLEEPARSLLVKEFTEIKLHAAIIARLLEGVRPIEKVIVCADVSPIDKVFGYVSLIHDDLVLGKFQALNDLRRFAGTPRLKSAADALAGRINKAIPKHRNIHRRSPVFDEAEIEFINHRHSKGFEWLEEKLRGFIESNR